MVLTSKEERVRALGLVTCMLAMACGSSIKGGTSGGSGATGGTATGQGGGNSGSGGAGPNGVSAGTVSAGGSGGMLPAPASGALPPLPAMSNVQVTPGNHTFTITFDPVDGAADYRAYALPKNEEVLLDPNDAT